MALEPRFEAIKTVAGTRSHHRFIPVNSSTLGVHRLSVYHLHTTVSISTTNDQPVVSELNLTIGNYVAAVYEWYIGIVTEKSVEHGDVINFMTRNSRTNILCWPSRKDECAVILQNVLCTVPVPDATGSTDHYYKLPSDIVDTINERYNFCMSCHN